MHVSIYIFTLMGESLVVYLVYRSCLFLCRYHKWVDLIILPIVDFYINLGNNWLSPQHPIFHCSAMSVTLVMLSKPRFQWMDASYSHPCNVISFIGSR